MATFVSFLINYEKDANEFKFTPVDLLPFTMKKKFFVCFYMFMFVFTGVVQRLFQGLIMWVNINEFPI